MIGALIRSFAVVALIAIGACEPGIVDGGGTPTAGGGYNGRLDNGVLLGFGVHERRDGNLTGTGSLGGVTFTAHGSVRGDSIEVTFLKSTGEIARLRARFVSPERRAIVGVFVAFGGYTDSDITLLRDQVQSEW